MTQEECIAEDQRRYTITVANVEEVIAEIDDEDGGIEALQEIRDLYDTEREINDAVSAYEVEEEDNEAIPPASIDDITQINDNNDHTAGSTDEEVIASPIPHLNLSDHLRYPNRGVNPPPEHEKMDCPLSAPNNPFFLLQLGLTVIDERIVFWKGKAEDLSDMRCFPKESTMLPVEKLKDKEQRRISTPRSIKFCAYRPKDDPNHEHAEHKKAIHGISKAPYFLAKLWRNVEKKMWDDEAWRVIIVKGRGRDCEGSHICLNGNCQNGDHIYFESHSINIKRNLSCVKQAGWVCRKENHDPKCIRFQIIGDYLDNITHFNKEAKKKAKIWVREACRRCPMCEFGLPTNGNAGFYKLLIHMESVHPEYVCIECSTDEDDDDKIFKGDATFLQHIDSEHPDIENICAFKYRHWCYKFAIRHPMFQDLINSICQCDDSSIIQEDKRCNLDNFLINIRNAELYERFHKAAKDCGIKIRKYPTLSDDTDQDNDDDE